MSERLLIKSVICASDRALPRPDTGRRGQVLVKLGESLRTISIEIMGPGKGTTVTVDLERKTIRVGAADYPIDAYSLSLKSAGAHSDVR